MSITGNTITSYLAQHAAFTPQAKAFIMPAAGDEEEWHTSFATLYNEVRQLGTALLEKEAAGNHVLLVYADVMAFIRCFLACQYAGLVAVPVFYTRSPRQLSRLSAIIEDADVSAVLCTSDTAGPLQQALGNFLTAHNIPLLYTNGLAVHEENILPAREAAGDTAFIQYTSGSTGSPKGVVVTHGNLLHNQQLLQHTFGCHSGSVILSWLPFHHDMGLIGNLLHGIYTGCSVVLMSPFRFMQKPLDWLQAISTYRVTHSGGPNFAYDLCVHKISPAELEGLDLSCWQVAYNGAEPIRPATLENFAGHFAAAGFSYQAFAPCYGLAEATLLVAGCGQGETALTAYINKHSVHTGRIAIAEAGNADAMAMVASGPVVPGMQLKIIAPGTSRICDELEEGEICIAGCSVTAGYRNKPVTGLFYELSEGRFLKTGDMGFLWQGQLFVHGRIKEMLIIRGENYYPYDIEQAAAESHEALEANGVAVFGLDEENGLFGIVAEVKRAFVQQADTAAILAAVEEAVSAAFGINPYDIVLTTPLAIPRTTSGKLQRTRCAALYRAQDFKILGAKRSGIATVLPVKDENLLQAVMQDANPATIRAYLQNLVEVKTGRLPKDAFNRDGSFTEMGLDSLRMMELLNTVNNDLYIQLTAEQLLEDDTVTALVNMIEGLLWLQQEVIIGNEIVI